MARIVDYRILWSNSSADLTKEVCQFLGSGWQPLESFTLRGDYFYQTLVKYEELVPLTAVRELPPGVTLIEPSWKRAVPAVTEEE